MFLPGESQGRGSLVGFHLWGCTESDMTDATWQQQQQQTQNITTEVKRRDANWNIFESKNYITGDKKVRYGQECHIRVYSGHLGEWYWYLYRLWGRLQCYKLSFDLLPWRWKWDSHLCISYTTLLRFLWRPVIKLQIQARPCTRRQDGGPL